MKGFIVINAYPNGEKFYHQAGRIASELQTLGIETDIFRNGELSAWITEKGEVETSLQKEYDFCVYLDKDKYLGELLQKSGLRLFNSASAVSVCDDKMSTYFALVGCKVPMAKTISAPLCYTPAATPSELFLSQVANVLGFPLVAKKSYGSFGAGVRLVRDVQELKNVETEWLYIPHFYQAFIEESQGKDVRVIVIGGRAVAAMERVAQEGEFRSNVELGGVGRTINLPMEYKELAERVADVLQLDYCGIDLLEGKDGGVVCEVNSNAFFEGMELVTGINVAKAYAEYIYKTVKNQNKSSEKDLEKNKIS